MHVFSTLQVIRLTAVTNSLSQQQVYIVISWP